MVSWPLRRNLTLGHAAEANPNPATLFKRWDAGTLERWLSIMTPGFHAKTKPW